MKIGIDCRVLNKEKQWAGVAQYTYNLFKNILALNSTLAEAEKNEYVLFWEKEAIPEFVSYRVKNVSLATTPAVSRLPIFYSHWQAALEMDHENLDLVHFPAGQVPLFLITPYIVTVHDLAVFRNPDWFGPQPLSRLISPLLWRRAAKIIAVSNFTKKELIDLIKIKSENLAVIYEGVGESVINFLKKVEPAHTSDYLLFLGTIEPRKNISILLKALDLLQKDLPDIKLVLAGKMGWKCENIIREIKKRSYADWKGYVSEVEKVKLLKGARALIYPSLYEGFGLPVLEALACSVPVVTSSNSSLSELAGDAAILVDPANHTKLAQSIKSVLNDEQLVQSLKLKGRARAAQFNWARAASETVEIYKESFKNCPRKL